MSNFKEKLLQLFGSQKAVADICEITESAVSQWTDMPPSKHLFRLKSYAEAHSIPFDLNNLR